MGNSDSKLEEIESLRQQNALNQAQIAQLQQAMSIQEEQRKLELKKQNEIKEKSKSINIPKNNPNSKEYNNYARQNKNRNSNDFRRNLGDRLFQDVENRNFYNQPQPQPQPQQKKDPPKSNYQPSPLRNVESSEIDPYKVLNLAHNFTEEDLKTSFKRLALKFHPDRPGGSEAHFNVIKNAYLELTEKLKMREGDRQFNELKNQSLDFLQNQPILPPQSDKPVGIFNPDMFNKLYDENRSEQANDKGYSDWMNDNNLDEKNNEPTKILKGKFNRHNFNNAFDKRAPKTTGEIIEYKVPQPLYSSNNINHTELGEDNIKNFSGKSGGIQYTDYRQAHTTSRLVDKSKVNRREYSSINQLESERSNITPLEEEEIRDLELDQREKKESDEINRQRQMERDNRAFEQYERLNQRMLQSVYK